MIEPGSHEGAARERHANEHPVYTTRVADFYNDQDAAAITELVAAYADDSDPIPESVKEEMVPGLRLVPSAFAVLAVCGEQIVGVAVCFLGYSTFAARPLVNIHDLVIAAEHRGRGVGSQLIRAVEAHARVEGSCKVTLEVRASNDRAESLYRRMGYRDPGSEPTRFLERLL
ncbi:MAG: GNAT family N-acetyltransferase [Planctomycetaceae bacterium]|nr:GNAT family N-acetyltransferase [Planctomycetaceae bacterium]